MGKSIWIIGFIVLLAIAGFYLLGNKSNGYVALASAEEVDFYKSGSCGCCGIHANYLDKEGNLDINKIELENMAEVKQRYGIPPALESCHTAIIGDYIVEGHMPLEVIDKLLTEKPDIKGIALPGMPSGSPGMPGTKKGEWIIYQLNKDGTYEEWMRY
jgi:hypothetical protein